MTRLERSKLSPAAWGLIGIAAMTITFLVIFVGSGPFTGPPYELRAEFRSDAELGVRSPVRVAGVDVGTVTEVDALGDGSDKAVAVMELDEEALPVHADATAEIRPRLLLEGNFYVDLSPGSPDAPTMDSGTTIAADRTSGPVQLDRVLSDLPLNTRTNLRTTIQGLGQSLDEPSGNDSKSAAEALNDSAEYSPEAFEGLIKTAAGLRGRRPRDLSGVVRNTSRVVTALASQEGQLSNLITGLDRTASATASRQEELRRSIELLPPVLGNARSALRSVNDALPATREFARLLTPSIEQLPGAIEAGYPWVRQSKKLLSRKELGGLLDDLQPATSKTASAVNQARPVLKRLRRIDDCLIDVLLPNGESVIDDPPLTTGATVNEEFFQTFVGLASATQNFDGNGRYVRSQSAGGAYPVQTSDLPGQGPPRGNAALPPIGTRPAYPGAAPPYRTDVKCGETGLPDLAASTGGGP